MILFRAVRLWVAALPALLFFGLLSAPPVGEAGPVHEVVLGFDILPRNPSAGTLAAGPGGYFWGTSDIGGAYGYGTIYKVKGDGTAWQVVLSFSGNGATNRGRTPYGGLVSDGAGSFWGTTQLGGASNLGTIFKVAAATGILTTVVEFSGTTGNLLGAQPQAALVSDGAGFFWGTTQLGGAANFGTVFKIEAATGALTTLVEFTNNGATRKGSRPQAALVADGAGSFWGTTFAGGAAGLGTIFKVDAVTGGLTTVLEFGGASGPHRGSGPTAALLGDGAGIFWGTTSAGGAPGHGTVFRLQAATGVLTTVVEFSDNGAANKGRIPYAALARDAAGFIWGCTYQGGAGGVGTVYKVNPLTGVLSTILEFTNNGTANKGAYPSAGLVSDGAGALWGTTKAGGPLTSGTVFRVDATTGVLTTAVDFTYAGMANRGRGAYGGLAVDGAGMLWGTTVNGGSVGAGTIFKLDPATGAQATIVEFTNRGTTNSGSGPYAGLVSDGAGHLWGTTQAGGTSGAGTLFKIHEATGVLTTLVHFTGNGGVNRGGFPLATLVPDGAGSLWGSAVVGGTGGVGTVFKVNIASGVLTTVVDFTGVAGANKGANPYATLVSDGAGFLWGSSYGGGAGGFGTLFKIERATGVLSTVLEFTDIGGANRGSSPWGGLAYDGAGTIWGTTQQGGAYDLGTLFKVEAATGQLTTLVDFNGGNGSNPAASLHHDGTGFIWGATQQGGGYTWGTSFKVNAATGQLAAVVQFSGVGSASGAGSTPGYGPLLRHRDGHLYGTTAGGGPGGGGTVFRLRFGPTPLTQPATAVTSTSALLAGTVNPNGDGVTTANFQYGTDPALVGATETSAVSLPNGTAALSITNGLSGLTPGATYYYRVVATNAGNALPQAGPVLSFTTVSNTAPTLALLGENPLIYEAAASYLDPGATADDAEDGTLVPVLVASGVIPEVPGTYAATWKATDSLGLTATATRTVHVVDTTPPVVTAPASVTVETGSSAGVVVEFEPATATDLVGVVSLEYSHESGSTFPVGTTVVTVTAMDASGNVTSVAFEITVAITPGIAAWRQAYFGTTSESGDAADLADPNGNGLVNFLEYALHYDPLSPTTGATALPQLGWSPERKLQLTLRRHADRTDLTLFIVGSDSPKGPWTNLATSIAGEPFAAVVEGVNVAEVPVDDSVQVTVSDSIPVTDPAHRQRFLRLKARLVDTPPVIVLLGADPLIFEAAEFYTDPGAAATDSSDLALEPELVEDNVVPNEPGEYTVTWQASDSAGRTSAITRTVQVVDTTPPTLTVPDDVLAGAGSDEGAVVHFTATAADAAGLASLVVSPASGTLFPIGTTPVTITATDPSGNTASATFAVTVTTGQGIAGWRERFFGGLNENGNSADLADPNGNGLVNLLEYALNGDPVDLAAGRAIAPVQAWSAGNRLQLIFTRTLDRIDLSLSVMGADSPSGPWVELATSTGGGPFVVLAPGAAVSETGSDEARQVTVTDLFPRTDPAHPRRFLGLRVRR